MQHFRSASGTLYGDKLRDYGVEVMPEHPVWSHPLSSLQTNCLEGFGLRGRVKRSSG